jgi:hypothetical protein
MLSFERPAQAQVSNGAVRGDVVAEHTAAAGAEKPRADIGEAHGGGRQGLSHRRREGCRRRSSETQGHCEGGENGELAFYSGRLELGVAYGWVEGGEPMGRG